MRKYPLTYNEFKHGLTEGKLLSVRCLDCGGYILPPNGVCIFCGSSKLKVEAISDKGKIKTFTVIRVAPAGFESPYIVAMVELNDGPWIVGNVVGIDPEMANMDLIEKEVSVGYKLVSKDNTEKGIEGVALTFKPLD